MKAGVLVVMARTPSKMVGGKERKQITAFIVDVDTPGLEITYRCRFMGLRALYNAVVKFTNVRVPRENIISKEGAGLKVALTTLEYWTAHDSRGVRRVVEAACSRSARKWAGERIQWGVPIGKHAAIAGKDCRDGGQRFRHGSDDVSHVVAGRSQSGRSAHRNRDVQNVGDGNDLANCR